MTTTQGLISKIANFFKSEEYYTRTGGDLFDAVKNGTSLPKIFEDIKAEIEHIDRYKDKFTTMYTRPDLIDMVIDDVLTIIDKHISGKKEGTPIGDKDDYPYNCENWIP